MSLLIAAVGCLALAPGAHALGLSGLLAAPASTNAGAHSNFNIHIGFTSPADRVKNLTVGLPPGLVGNPTATPLCTSAQLQADSCPSGTQVGTVTTAVTAHLLNPLPVTVNMTVDGSLYNVEPASGQPARFGIVLRPIGSQPLPLLQKIVQTSDVRLRSSDYGLDTVLVNIPNVARALTGTLTFPIDIRSIDIRLSGTVGGKAFMRNPTSCGTKTTNFTANSYANPGQQVTGQASFTSTNCAALPFSPKFLAVLGSPGHTAPGTKPQLVTLISQADTEAGLKDAQVLLPSALIPNFTVLANPCSEAQFRSNIGGCPADSIVGIGIATSTYVRGYEAGAVVIVAPAQAGALPRLGVDLHGPLALQLLGNFVATPSGLGQAFTGLPDIPISNFILVFLQDRLLVATSNLCQPPAPTFPITFGGWNGATQSFNGATTPIGCP